MNQRATASAEKVVTPGFPGPLRPMVAQHVGVTSFNPTDVSHGFSLRPESGWPQALHPSADRKLGLGQDFGTLPVHANAASENQSQPTSANIHQVTRDMEGAMDEDASLLSDDDGGSAAAVAPAAGVGPDAGVGPAQAVPAQVAPPSFSALAVTVPTHIRGSSSPAGMPDRIPPRIDTPVAIGIAGWSIPMIDVTLSIEGAGGGNGTATINGAATVDLNANATVQLRGVNQTAVGNAGNLRLVAKQGGTRLAASDGFSVSSIPQDWSVTFNSLITGTSRGIAVNNNWVSDSGSVADLDEAERSEQVQYGAGTGCFAGVTGRNSGFMPANSPPLVDSHGTPVALMTGVGRIVAEQTFIFNDKRSGAVNIPARNSGFQLTREVIAPTATTLQLTTTKAGTATTANGFASAAASGSVSRAQAV